METLRKRCYKWSDGNALSGKIDGKKDVLKP
jgi:hypothetical protein